MKTLHVLYHLARADFFERIRRYSFLLVLASAVFAGYLFVPPVGAGYRVLQVGTQRGIYDSAWIGLMFGLIAALHLPLVGFYLVKNAVERDRQTRVGQIIATTPISRPVYVLGKWLSNLAVLALILSVMTVMAVVMQLLRAEAATVRLWAMVASIWLMGLPVLSLAAALAILFECIPFLRGGLGNVVFFFLWLATLIVVLSGSIDQGTALARPASDPYGYTRQLAGIQQQVLAADPDAQVGSGLVMTGPDIEGTFVWNGFSWKMSIIAERMLWAGLALVIALVASIPFDRFDPTHRLGPFPARAGLLLLALLCAVPLFVRDVPLQERLIWVGVGIILALIAVLPFHRLVPARRRARVSDPRRLPDAVARPRQRDRGPSAETGDLQEATSAVRFGKVRTSLTPLAAAPSRGRFAKVLAAELKLMLKGQSLLWYVGGLGLNLACLLNPSDTVQRYLLLAVWVWPVLIWSPMGVRERRYNTAQMVFSVPRPALRQLPAMWLAGVLVAVVGGCGAWLYLALTGQTASLLAWFVGALFVPALALALGVWTGSSRAFEAVYLLLWYLGPVEGLPALDYPGATAGGLALGMPFVYLGITAVLLVLAVLGRWRQVPVGALRPGPKGQATS